MMACAMKFSAGAVRNQLRHNRRTIEHSSNRDIDPERLEHDYVLSPDRGMTEYDYFLQRKSELYCYNRDDVKVMVGWIVTAPQDLDPARYDDFFCASYDFMVSRYGEENVVQAIVHDDEGGQPHLHFCFIPVEEDLKHEQGYKICANDVLDRRELRNFHPDLQRYLDEHGLEGAHVMTGVTKRQGGNRTVAELKAEREQEYQQKEERPALYFWRIQNGTRASLLRGTMKQIIWIINCYLYGATLILLAVLALLVYLRGQANHLPNPFARRNIVYRPKEKAQGVLLGKKFGLMAYSPEQDEGHILVMGPSGTGKTSAY